MGKLRGQTSRCGAYSRGSFQTMAALELWKALTSGGRTLCGSLMPWEHS